MNERKCTTKTFESNNIIFKLNNKIVDHPAEIADIFSEKINKNNSKVYCNVE